MKPGVHSFMNTPFELANLQSIICPLPAGIIADYDDDEALAGAKTAETMPLRVATVQTTSQGGTSFTLVGQLTSIKDLTDAMLASQPLAASLSPINIAFLQKISATPADYDTLPAVNTLIAGLENPIPLEKLMGQLEAVAPVAAEEARANAAASAAAAELMPPAAPVEAPAATTSSAGGAKAMHVFGSAALAAFVVAAWL
jgi:hypothetical protein